MSGRAEVAALAMAAVVAMIAAACAPAAPDGEDALHAVEWTPHVLDSVPPLDRGVGVLYFARLPGTASRPVTDSLPVLADSSRGADTVALFLLQEASPQTYRYAVATPDSATPNVLEFDYEIAGLPVDTLPPGGRWARVVAGFGRDGRPRTGWAALHPEQVRVLLWRERLPQQPLIFMDGQRPAFHATPGGPPVTIALGADGGYSMEPLEVRGDWLRVRVDVPPTYCYPENVSTATSTEAWIRFVDERGRPAVWYHTRGC